MRTFTDREKQILNKIAELKKKKGLQTVDFGNICGSFLEHEFIHIDFNKNTEYYNITFRPNGEYYNHGRGGEAAKKQIEIERNIIDSISLLYFLTENRLIIQLNCDYKEANFNIVPEDSYDLKTNHLQFRSNFDSETQKFIVYLLVRKKYIIRQEFLEFVDNGFVTADELHFKKSQKVAWSGIYIAILIGIASIWFSIHSGKETAEVTTRQTLLLDSCLNEMKRSNQNQQVRDSLFMDVFRQGLDMLNKRMVKSEKKGNNTDTLNTEKKKMKK